MKIDFEKLMSEQTDEGLQEYIDKRKDFVPAAVEAAIAEMQKRGRVFSDEELSVIRQEFQQKREEASLDMEPISLFGNRWKKNVVTDESAPEYYSERAIYSFSVIFSMLFGAVLSAINFSKNEDKKGVFEVMGFGVCYTSFEMWLISEVKRASSLALTLNIIGALILQYYWKKYIGTDTKYRAKPIGKALIVAAGISVLLFIAMFNGA